MEMKAVNEKDSPPCLLIILHERGSAIPATLAEFTGDAPSNPPHLHDVHFTATGADALHLRFSEAINLGYLIRLWVSILQRLFYMPPEIIRFM
jgi:hypothetical protein